ncbi:MAG: hypothetical protein ACKPKO_37430, partial [Candidatus Fonsibacter sp.]
MIEWVQECGGGFRCTQLRKSYNKRKEHINCIADETGTIDGTWVGIRDYIIMARLSMSFLKNLTELMNECEVPNPQGA